jgi:enoyl-CoA hydratase/carnithine racemase
MDMVFTSCTVDAQDALGMRLIRRAVPHDRLMEQTMAYAEQIAAQAPAALQRTLSLAEWPLVSRSNVQSVS